MACHKTNGISDTINVKCLQDTRLMSVFSLIKKTVGKRILLKKVFNVSHPIVNTDSITFQYSF